MADVDSIMNDSSDDTQMGPGDGRESPVIPQTPQTKAREKQRSNKRGAVRPRSRGVATRVRVASSRSRSRSSTPPETPVAGSQRGRGRTREGEGRSERAQARSAALDAANASLNTIRESRATGTDPVISPSETTETTSSTPPAAPQEPRGRKRKSIIWNHCRQRVVNKTVITYCNHCECHWNLSGSTSTALQHLRTNHLDCLTDAEEHQLFSDNEPTAFGAKAPKRQVKCYGDMTSKILHDSYKGRKLNKYLCMALLSGSVSWNFLDNAQFAIFVEHLSNHQYKLPSRTYMLTCVVPGVYEACKEGVRAILHNKKNISFTTDAWRSISKDSYITITAHVLDDNLELHSLVLDTSEIKKRHFS